MLYAGNIKPHKNVDRLIEAFSILRAAAASNDVKLLIIGDEISKYPNLRRLVHRFQLHQHVRFLGFVPDATLAALYRLASVVRVSVALRGLRPAAARGDGGGRAGDHVERLVAARGRRRRGAAHRSAGRRRDRRRDGARARRTGLRAELVRRGHERVKAFSWERSVARVREVYQQRELRAERRRVRAQRPPIRLTPVAAGRRVVLVHDWLTGMRGGEKVLESICRLFPDADLSRSSTSAAAVSPLIERPPHPHVVRPAPAATRRAATGSTCRCSRRRSSCFDLDDADLVISTSHCAAKAVVAPGRAVHVCYCHSPMRYAWDQFDAYFGAGARRARGEARWRGRCWRGWRGGTATRRRRVDRFVANSRYVAGRIARYYNRSASVLYPPVDVRLFHARRRLRREPYFLVVSALVPYKRIEVAIRAAAASAGVR